jgi:hypothetical protein
VRRSHTLEETYAILRLATCHHEAAHAVVALKLGLEVHYLEIYETSRGEGARVVIVPKWASNDDGTYFPTFENAVVDFAGEHGHTKYFSMAVGDPTAKPDARHFRRDRNAAKRVATDRKVLKQYSVQAKLMVDENWNLIELVAQRLNEKSLIYREELKEICGLAATNAKPELECVELSSAGSAINNI